MEILWDCTVSTDRRLEEEGNRPDLVTDRRETVINVVEMACPSWGKEARHRHPQDREIQNDEERTDGKK